MIAVMWAYEGWYYLPFCAGEIKDPRRTVPIALVIGIVALVLIYLSVNLAYMLALPLSEIQGVERIAEKAVTALVGAGGARIVAATVVVSTLGCNAAVVIAMSRACYAMAADGMFFKAAAAVHPAIPHAACRDRDDVRLVRAADADRHVRTALHLGHLRVGDVRRARRPRDLPAAPVEAGCRAARTAPWGYPLVPALFVAGLGVLVVNTVVEKPAESLIGIALVALGLPAYWYWSGVRTRRR